MSGSEINRKASDETRCAQFYEDGLTVRVVGGLGNQLFQYYAGNYYSKIAGKRLVIDTSHVGVNRTNHGVSIEDFILPGLFVDRRSQLGDGKHTIERLAIRVNEKFAPLRYPSSKKLGLDLDLEVTNRAVHLSGYFQSSFYVENALELDPAAKPKIRNASPWLLDKTEEAKEMAPVILHVRRGDYLTKEDSFGLLASGYYRDAVLATRNHGITAPIWVLSDDMDAAKNLLKNHLPGDTEWILPPADTRASESLALMWHGGSHIIANSTFSWFGAMLSDSSKFVVRPDKWFYKMGDPESLGKASWTTIQSKWVNNGG